MPSLFNRLILSAFLLLLSVATAASAADAPVPRSAFFDNPAFSAPTFSPDGKHLALVLGGGDQRDRLAVLTLSDMSLKVVAHFSDLDVRRAQWVNNERLVFDTRDTQLAPGDRDFGPGMWSVKVDGSDRRQLVMRRFELEDSTGTLIKRRVLAWNHFLLDQAGAQDSSIIYLSNPRWDDKGDIAEVNLVRLDTTDGTSQSVPHPANARDWLLDQKGMPRLVTTYDQGRIGIHYLNADNTSWRKVAEFDRYKGGADSFNPLAFGPDGTLYVEANGANADTSALHTFDLGTGKISKNALLSLKGYDFTGSLVLGQERLLGIHYNNDAGATVWYDAALKASQAKVDALLPGTVNRITKAVRATTPWLLVASNSDHQPEYYRLFNADTQELVNVGGTYPAIDPVRMANLDLVHYQARDGLKIPAWLTLPKGTGKNLPMVVLVHGGPFVRGGEWTWEPQAQFLASRGYAVLEPEFRGSAGFGDKHLRAGWKQWGLAMQDDLADGVRWAIAQGIADGKRVCIAGASYGGYAALMGVIKDANLFQCAINWAGVTDLDLLYQWRVDSDMSASYQKYGLPDLLGDRVADADRLRATSPVHQAARVTRPVLLAYGTADRRVPLIHGNKFYDAVKAVNPNVEWVQYQDEGHGWSLPQNRIDFWGRVEKFLEKHIGKQ